MGQQVACTKCGELVHLDNRSGSRRRKLILLAALIGLIALIAAIGIAARSGGPSSITVAAMPGAVAELDGVRVTLNEIVDPWVWQPLGDLDSELDDLGLELDDLGLESPGERNVAFSVVIENTRDSGFHDADRDRFLLSDSENFAYQFTYLGEEPQMEDVYVGPGHKTRGWVTFRIDESASLNELEYYVAGANHIVFQFEQGSASP